MSLTALKVRGTLLVRASILRGLPVKRLRGHTTPWYRAEKVKISGEIKLRSDEQADGRAGQVAGAGEIPARVV